jgi:two-component system response regulator DegU
MAMNTPLRLLLVDDSVEVRRTIRAVVAGLVAEVAECADGDEVLARFEAFRPDLVLMDIRMPRMDGIRATELLKAAHPGARVVMVSDFEEDDLRAAARDAGAEAYVPKSDLLVLRDLLETELKVEGRQ